MGKPLPIRLLPIGHLLGVHEGIESLVLPVALSSGGSRNIWMDKLARVTSIGGYTKRNQTPVVTNGSSINTHLCGLYHYTFFNPVSGFLTRTEFGVFDDDANLNLELWISSNGGRSWTFLYDYGSGLIEYFPDFAQLGSALAISLGSGPVKAYDGTTLSDASSLRLAAPVVTDAGAGLLGGRYRWWVVPLKGDGTRKSASVGSSELILNLRNATVTWVADTDTTVTGYEIYRTFGEGSIGFFEGAVDGRTTVSFTSVKTDQQVVLGRALAEYGEPPPHGVFFVETHKQRMWYGRTNLFPRRWWFSDVGLPYSTHPDTFYIDATDAESMSDVSTGATGGFTRQGLFGGDDMMVIWLERSVWTVTGTGRIQSAVLAVAAAGNVIDWELKRSNARIGSVSHRAVARIPKGATWTDQFGQSQTSNAVTLAYLSPLGDVRMFDGIDDEIISYGMQDAFRRLNYGARRKAYCLADNLHSEITWFIPYDEFEERFLALTWNYQYGTWTEREWPFAFATEIEEENDAAVIIAGEQSTEVGGYCYTVWDGFTFDGVAVNSQITTKTLYGSLLPSDKFDMVMMLAMEKRWRWVQLLVKSTLSLDLLLEWWPTEADVDNDDPFGSRIISVEASVPLLTSDGEPILTSDGSPLGTTPPAGPRVIRSVLTTTEGRYLHSRGIRLRLSSETITTEWSLVGLALGYQILPGLKRGFRR